MFLTQPKRIKSDPTFGSEKFTVVAREGAKVVVRSERGVLYSRNVEDAKRTTDNSDFQVCQDTNIDSPENVTSDGNTIPNLPILDEVEIRRPSRQKKIPKRFDDMLLYSVYE